MRYAIPFRRAAALTAILSCAALPALSLAQSTGKKTDDPKQTQGGDQGQATPERTTQGGTIQGQSVSNEEQQAQNRQPNAQGQAGTGPGQPGTAQGAARNDSRNDKDRDAAPGQSRTPNQAGAPGAPNQAGPQAQTGDVRRTQRQQGQSGQFGPRGTQVDQWDNDWSDLSDGRSRYDFYDYYDYDGDGGYGARNSYYDNDPYPVGSRSRSDRNVDDRSMDRDGRRANPYATDDRQRDDDRSMGYNPYSGIYGDDASLSASDRDGSAYGRDSVNDDRMGSSLNTRARDGYGYDRNRSSYESGSEGRNGYDGDPNTITGGAEYDRQGTSIHGAYGARDEERGRRSIGTEGGDGRDDARTDRGGASLNSRTRAAQDQDLEGEIVSTQSADYFGNRHTLAKVRDANGREMVVDLGPEDKLADLKLSKGDSIRVNGRRGMLTAGQISAKDKTITIDERWQRDGANQRPGRIRGQIDTVQTRSINGQDHVIAYVDAEDHGGLQRIDLGPKDKLGDRELSTGDMIEVEGTQGRDDRANYFVASRLRSRRLQDVQQDAQSGAQSNAGGASSPADVSVYTGRIVNQQLGTVDGQSHVLATVKLHDGRQYEVDLGPRARLAGTNFGTGDEIQLQGTRGEVGGGQGLLASRVKLGDGDWTDVRGPSVTTNE